MPHLLRSVLRIAILMCVVFPATIASAQTPAASPADDGLWAGLPESEAWWTAWSTCEITPVQSGPTPEHIPGIAEHVYWLQAETTNDSDIDMLVWLWTGNRPLPLNGEYVNEGMYTKWLWAFSEDMRDISVTLTSETGAEGNVQFGGAITSSSTGPVNGWPSYVIVPDPGCWTFDITATALDGEVYMGSIVFPAVP